MLIICRLYANYLSFICADIQAAQAECKITKKFILSIYLHDTYISSIHTYIVKINFYDYCQI